MKVSGEGLDKPRKPEDELPIDINFSKMEDWLSERQKIRGDWRNVLRKIQEKLEGAIEGLPDNPALNAAKSGINVKEMNYFTCKSLRDILTSEKDTAQKNWLGQYKNQATKEWEAILAMYHKDNVHLAEAAMIMNQNVQFEIPALRKIVHQATKQQQELQRKEGEYKRGSDDYKMRYERECRKLGIEGVQVKKELLKRSEMLPQLYLDMMAAAKSPEMRAATELYVGYYAYSTKDSSKSLEHLLPSLCRVLDEDLPTLEAMERIAFSEDVVTMEDMMADVGGGAGGGDGIDWGDIGGGDAGGGGAEIDWGGLDDAGAGAGGEIDWGDMAVEGGGAGGGGIDWGDAGSDAGVGGGAAVDIDWGEGEEFAIEVEEDGAEDYTDQKVPGEVFKTGESRSRLINDLLELKTFLQTRKLELESTEYIAVEAGSDGRPPALLNETKGSVASLLRACEEVLELINAPTTQQLIMLRCSRRFLDRLVSQLEMRLANSTKLAGLISVCQKKRDDLSDLIVETQPKIRALSTNTRAVQRGAEQIMTEQYKGRRVNIVGDINTVLSNA